MSGLMGGVVLGSVVLLATPPVTTPTHPWTPLQPRQCHPSCGSSQGSPQESYFYSVLGGFQGEVWQEVLNCRPKHHGEGHRTSAKKVGSGCPVLAAPPVALPEPPSTSSPRSTMPVSTTSKNRPTAYTGLVVPTAPAPWAQPSRGACGWNSPWTGMGVPQDP